MKKAAAAAATAAGTSRTIVVKVKANAKTTSFDAAEGEGEYACSVQAPPLEGRANKEVCRLAAEHFGVAKSRVSLVRGETSTTKVLLVEGIAPADK
jgi:uncharacterized protein (TIGR00251 family)